MVSYYDTDIALKMDIVGVMGCCDANYAAFSTSTVKGSGVLLSHNIVWLQSWTKET
jgi:hypothetical protein